MSVKKVFLYSIIILVLITVSISITTSANSLTASEEAFFSQNDILFYDPSCEDSNSSSGSTCFDGTELTWSDIDECGTYMYYCVAKKLISTYGEFAIALQEEYGYPWEVLFGQMMAESQMGVSGNPNQRDLQIKELSGATEFNLMGITVEDNDTIMNWADNKYDLTPGSHQWPGFKNISTMLVAYLVEFPRRSESTSRKLEVLKPDNYDIETYVKSYLGGYSQSSTQADNVLGFIDNDWDGEEYHNHGLIGYIRDELGLPSSAELAKEKNIQPGGRWPIDQYTGYQEVSKTSFEKYGKNGLECKGGSSAKKDNNTDADGAAGGNAAIVQKAKELSWPEGQRPSDIMFANEAYTNAAKKWGGQFITAGDCNLSSLTSDHPGLQVCPSCARFVSMVILEAGIDPEFTEESEGGKAHLLSMSGGGLTNYLINSSKWTEVEDYDGRGYDKLQPGDILVADAEYRPSHIKVDAPYSDHTFIYLGNGKVAEASNKYAGGFQYSWNDGVGGPNDGYVAFRYASNCIDSDITWENGWITGGIDGYTKDLSQSSDDDAWQTQFITNSPATGTVGPNKITLHTLEGAFSNVPESATDAYEGVNRGYPPHFTIDIKRKHIWQHLPITKPSCAIAVHDNKAGVQIEIMGYSSADAAASKGQPDWLLSDGGNFSSDDWAYLGELLRGISAETGIPLDISIDTSNPSRLSVSDYQAYEGIIGHVNAPDNDHGDPAPGIWPFIEGAIDSSVNCFNNRSSACQVENKSWTGDFPVWGQGDEPWRDYTFNACGQMWECGCGVVSFAMMATVLDGVEHSPVEVGKAVDAHGLMVSAGSDHSLPTVLAPEFGLVAESISVDETTASRYLRDGWMIWTCGINVPGLFSGNGHCIGLRGITSDGKWLLADSGNTANMATPFEPSVVLTGIYNNGGPMVALKKKGT